ncbi:MAG: hypothetical protein CM1200mP15_20830 [Dehalococcoidia bacterium]|nr:MAG: hypothetical protein CM1200mP15_20830 [Dehalococcoidia bacterium]
MDRSTSIPVNDHEKMSLVERGGTFTYEGPAEKVWSPEHGVRTTETIAQILGPYGQLLNGSEAL